ncbi:hypothetical protein J3U18_07305 [Gilliamella sp. B3482]|uniref:hypothetical protein n=1 Tax=unclassified Gilliamella TaxID=2685620 RepID=UPI0008106A31|nr:MULTISPECIES: hypothetical protein [Gilliamella]MCX8581494.1 hypothetical protein [Gilliamella sp. B3482]MCX8585182.1 hypothetical protein [Gilliamella sp. B3562]MCX8675419.1 hypothetical protein [Gilliamella sp. B3023]MCX8685152.1 hypothetical protein [Gilliamella sp. B2864]OCL23388.1 hypothetical protein A9G07_06320 [Gilliamella apicola]
MDITQLLQDNWFNLFIIFALSIIGFIYKRNTPNNYFDNIIRYTDILEKVPQPSYQKDYLNNIKKKLIWEKVCFYKPGNINKERIAISVVNADIHNVIELSQLNQLTQYFGIEKNRITFLRPFLIKDVILTAAVSLFTFFMVIYNLHTIFKSEWIINVIISVLTIFVLIIIIAQFAKGPLKRLNSYRILLKDRQFLIRANKVFAKILDENRPIDTLSKEIDKKESTDLEE